MPRRVDEPHWYQLRRHRAYKRALEERRRIETEAEELRVKHEQRQLQLRKQTRRQRIETALILLLLLTVGAIAAANLFL